MLGTLIKDYLKEHGISQKWLSDKTGIPLWKITSSLNNKRELLTTEYCLICSVLEVPFNYFIPASLYVEQNSKVI